MKRRYVAFALVAPFLLSACGTAAPEPKPTAAATTAATTTSTAASAPPVKSATETKAGAAFNDTDVMFLQMLAHNERQGMDLADIAAERATRPAVIELAQAIKVTQADELKMIEAWLTEWKKPTEAAKVESVHADHGGLPATTQKEIDTLKTVKKADFETAFLNIYVGHQHTAVEVAQLATKSGSNAQVKALANRVKDSRTAQIQQMLKLLNP